MIDDSLKTKFSAQMKALSPGREQDNVQPLEMLLEDDLPLRITLHPNGRFWIIEAFLHDARKLQGPLRHLLVKSLLKVNGVALEGQQVICTLNRDDLVVLMTRWPADERSNNDFLPWLNYTIEQARHTREVVRSISMCAN